MLVRRGHTEAAVDLARMAGLTPAGVLVEVVNDDGTMKRGPRAAGVRRRARPGDDLDRATWCTTAAAPRATSSGSRRPRLPTRHGEFTAYGYRITVDGTEHVALVYGDPVDSRRRAGAHAGALRVPDRRRVRLASAATAARSSTRRWTRIVEEGRGVVVYLRGHEGRGIGLVAKLQAYQLQDGGRDTVDANLDLGLPADARHYGAATQILRDLGVDSVRLLTNNPDKTASLEDYGVPVAERVPLTPRPNDHNLAYLRPSATGWATSCPA